MKHTQTRRRRWRPPNPYLKAMRELQRRAEAMTQGNFTILGIPLEGPNAAEDLRRAIDVLGEHVEQFHRGMHASVAALTSAQEAERSRIARELHDDTVQRLVAFGHSVDRIQRALERDPALAQQRLGQLRGDVIAMVQALRALIGDLRPPALDELGLIPAVEFLLGRDAPGDPEIELVVEGHTRRLDPQSELAVFRIVQEAWNNVRRHAGAQHTRFTFAYTRNALVVTVKDDGRGFPEREAGSAGWGLIGMRERAALVGGSIAVDSQPGHGATIEVRVPYLGVGGRDPICGMEVGPDALQIEYEGTLYRFCSQACHDLFAAEPQRYVQQVT